MGANFQDTKAAEKLKAYLQSFCEGYYAGIADFVASKVECFDGGVFLSKIKHKDTVSGALTGVKTHPKYEQALAACGWPVSGYKGSGEAEALPPSLLRGLLRRHRQYCYRRGPGSRGCYFPARIGKKSIEKTWLAEGG